MANIGPANFAINVVNGISQEQAGEIIVEFNIRLRQCCVKVLEQFGWYCLRRMVGWADQPKFFQPGYAAAQKLLGETRLAQILKTDLVINEAFPDQGRTGVESEILASSKIEDNQVVAKLLAINLLARDAVNLAHAGLCSS